LEAVARSGSWQRQLFQAHLSLTLCQFATWFAAEIAVLSSGFTLRIDRHELRGENVILHSANGQTVLPKSAVVSFEALPEDAPTPEPQAAAPVALAPAEPPPPPKSPRELVRAAAELHGLPAAFVESVARAESAFDPAALSPKGAIGLMQLMPATAKALGANPHDAKENAEAGAKLLRDLLIQYQDHPDQVRRALAAYNAGPGAVKKYNGVPPYAETQTYVDRVLRQYRKTEAVAATPR
jgi:hypothetical protein